MLVLEARGDLIWESWSEISVALKADAFSVGGGRTEQIYRVIFGEKTRIASGKVRMILTEEK